MSFGIRTPMKSKLTSMQAVQYRQEQENPTLSSTTVDSTSSTEPKLGSLYDNDDHNKQQNSLLSSKVNSKPQTDITPSGGLSIKLTGNGDLF